MGLETFIAYCSPAGSTRRVAGVIKDQLTELGLTPTELDLADRAGWAGFRTAFDRAGRQGLLFLGSPVYGDAAVGPVIKFIDSLPASGSGWAVPFITWGGAFSGLALWQMGRAMLEKGISLAGGVKVMAVHSMMWTDPDPVGAGRPNRDDDLIVREMVRLVAAKFDSAEVAALSLNDLDYHPLEAGQEAKLKLAEPKRQVEKPVDADKCTGCGICVENCPTGSVALDPTPVFDDQCIGCCNCVRLCPEGAIDPGRPLDKVAQFIRDRAANHKETPQTAMFV